MPRRRQPGEYWLGKVAGSDCWYIHWYDPKAGRVRRKSTGTADGAEAEIAKAEFVLDRVTLKKADPGDIPLALILNRYLDQHAVGLASAASAGYEIGHWLRELGDAYVSDLAASRIDDFIATLRRRGLSAGYVSRILSTGRAALNRAYRRGELAAVPYIPDVKRPRSRDRILTQDEMLSYMTEGPQHWFVFCMVMANTLCRPQNALDLTRFQCDLDAGVVHLNPPDREQTRKYRPVVPLTRTLMPIIKASGGHIVQYRGEPVASVKTAARNARDGAGLEGVEPKTIRYTMATWLREQGVPPWEVSGMLGHRGKDSVTEEYAKYVPGLMRHAAEAIDDYFAPFFAQCSRKSPSSKTAG